MEDRGAFSSSSILHFTFLILHSSAHFQQHVCQAVDDIEERAPRLIELIGGGLIFGGGGARRNASQPCVVAQQLRLCAEFYFQIIQPFAHVSETVLDSSFASRGLLVLRR